MSQDLREKVNLIFQNSCCLLLVSDYYCRGMAFAKEKYLPKKKKKKKKTFFFSTCFGDDKSPEE